MMDTLILEPNQFIPKSTSIDADRWTGSRPALYRLPDPAGLTLDPGANQRELTILSVSSDPVPLQIGDPPFPFPTDGRSRLVLPPGTALQLPPGEPAVLREEWATAPPRPADGRQPEESELRLLNRHSPVQLRCNRTLYEPATSGGILYPSLNHGLSDVLRFAPDQHFRGQFKVHPSCEIVLTPLVPSQSEIILEAIDLRSHSSSRLSTDALVLRPTPFISMTIPAGVAYRLQGRRSMLFRVEYVYYADASKTIPSEIDVLWLGVGLAWPSIRVPSLRVSDEFIRAHFDAGGTHTPDRRTEESSPG